MLLNVRKLRYGPLTLNTKNVLYKKVNPGILMSL